LQRIFPLSGCFALPVFYALSIALWPAIIGVDFKDLQARQLGDWIPLMKNTPGL
jgi:hypothetical protein